MNDTVTVQRGREPAAARRHRMGRPVARTAVVISLACVAGALSATDADAKTIREYCTSATVTVTYRPGLTATAQGQTARVEGTLSGCYDGNGVATPGSARLTGSLSGPAQVGAVELAGAGKLVWSASSGLAPSSMDLRLIGPDTGPGGVIYSVLGLVTDGACAGADMSDGLPLVETRGRGTDDDPVVAQRYADSGSTSVVNFIGETGAPPHC